MSDPAARPSTLRLGALVLVALLALLALLVSMRPSGAPEAAPPEAARAERTRVVLGAPEAAPDGPLDEASLEEAARGDLGLSLRNRVCALCAAGALGEAVCGRCNTTARAGRVVVDVVGTDGRPFPDHSVMVTSECSRYGGGGSGFLDLPEGRCELTAVRVDGPFHVPGEPVTVDVVADEETYLLLEVPSDPWGGVGVNVRGVGEDLVVDQLFAGAAAEGILGEGAVLLGIDGRDVEGMLPREVAQLLAGPAGTSVEVRFGVEGADGWVEQTVRIERRVIRAHEVPMTARDPG
ncbi:MAG: hypothetical protein H6737_29425 [Alphaproteobacteria bacterium]|nr:hypothetical protein [Alphaproteobacteria bacterium]MCB9690008.1 hypothetical protein [Alphaproteobacteria bacterium]